MTCIFCFDNKKEPHDRVIITGDKIEFNYNVVSIFKNEKRIFEFKCNYPTFIIEDVNYLIWKCETEKGGIND